MVKLSLFKWLLRQRDANAVNYSRFGMPGEEQEDRPPPTTIVLEQFDENAAHFRFGSMCHARRAAQLAAGFGMSMAILVFIALFFEFDWIHHDRGVDFLALLALFLFLSVGVLIHYGALHGIDRQRPLLLVPFLYTYLLLIVLESIGLLTAGVDLTVDRGPSPAVYEHRKVAVATVLVVIPVVAVQLLMLVAVHKCKLFLSKKEQYEISLKIAQRSSALYPGLRVVTTNGLPPSIPNGSAIVISQPPPPPPSMQNGNVSVA